MLSSDWNFKINAFEALLLSGKQSQVAAEVTQVIAKKPPREVLAPLAAIARRAGFPYLALSVLQPIFRSEGRKALSPPTPFEAFVYGSVLVVLGAKTEGLNLLESIDPNEHPEVLLFQANSKISDWDYQNAKPLLEKFLCYNNLKPIQRLVGNLNLCSCYIVLEKPKKFNKVLTESYQLAETASARHLMLSLVELESQYFFYQKNYQKTQAVIGKYNSRVIERPKTIFEALLRKWDLLSLAYLNDTRKKQNTIIEELHNFAIYCKANKYWEIYRDCDFHYGLLSGKFEHVLKSYFGSPSKEYRKNLQHQIKGTIDIPKNWINSDGNQNNKFINRTEATFGFTQLSKPYKRSWNLFFLLTKDLYKPMSLAKLFNDLFPGEYFVKSLAAHRIQQQLSELRSTFLKNNLDLKVNIEQNTYQLHATPLSYMILKIHYLKIVMSISFLFFKVKIKSISHLMKYKPFSIFPAPKLYALSKT